MSSKQFHDQIILCDESPKCMCVFVSYWSCVRISVTPVSPINDVHSLAKSQQNEPPGTGRGRGEGRAL